MFGFVSLLVVEQLLQLNSMNMFNRKEVPKRVLKRNPLKNSTVMSKLNPFAIVEKKQAKLVEKQQKKKRQEMLDARRGVS